MKNKLVRLLVMMLVTGSVLTACGSEKTSTEAENGSDVSTDIEIKVDYETENITEDTSTKMEYGVSNPDATYNETKYCYIVSDAAFVEKKYNDGTEFDTTNWTPVNTIIKLKAPISIYNPFKDIMGYMKTDVTVVYVSVDEEWSYLGFSEEVVADGLYSNGGTYVRTDELIAAMEGVVVENEESAAKEMSEKTVTYLGKIKEVVAQVNDERVVIREENPSADAPKIEEAESKDGLECFGSFNHKFDDNADELEIMLILVRTEVYDKYYIEYVDETDTSVEFNFYCTIK